MKAGSSAPVCLAFLFCLAAAAAWAQDSAPAPGEADLTARIEALNAQLELPGAAPASDLLALRHEFLGLLVRRNPDAVRRVALSPAGAARLRSTVSGAADLLEESGEWTGELQTFTADDFENHRGQTRRKLRTPQGPLEFFTRQAALPGVQSGATLRVRGIRTGDAIAAESIQLQAAAPEQCSTTGPQKIAVLTVTTPSNPVFPSSWNSASLQQAYFSTSGVSLNSFWQEASYGQASAAGQIFGPFSLTQDYDCAHLDALSTAAIQAAAGSVDFSQYSRVAVIFPVQSCVLPGFGSLGGYGSIGCYGFPSITQNVSMAWFPVYPADAGPGSWVGIAAHEHGHNLGLDHGNTEDYRTVPLGAFGDDGVNIEYGDPFSVMGNAGGNTVPLTIGQYSAPHKALLHWLKTPDYHEVQTAGTFKIAPYESAAGTRGLRVLRDVSTASWLWLEYRQPVGAVDSTLALRSAAASSNVFSGALVHYENPDLDLLHTYLLHFHPSGALAGNNFNTAALTPGQLWSDPASLLTLTAGASDATGMSIAVAYALPCATVQTPASFPASAASGAIVIAAAAACQWTVSTSDSWIRLTGPLSGAGPATLSFSLSANTAASQRRGYIAIQRQSVAVMQAGTGLSVLSANPTVTVGNSGSLTVLLNDALGYRDIGTVYVTFSGAPACEVPVTPANSAFYLVNDAATAWLGPVTQGILSNSVCSISTVGSSISGLGNELRLTLQMSFQPAFAGSHRITVTVQNAAGQFATATFGTWTVPCPEVWSFSPSSITAGGPALTLTVNGAGFTPGASVQADGATLATTVLSDTQVSASLPAAKFASAGTIAITVVDPGPLGSNVLALPVTAGTPQLPAINEGGIVPLGSTVSILQPGSWVSLYGTNLASGDYLWKNDFPASLGGVAVTVDGKPAYLWSVSPRQINFQVPDGTALGSVDVVVTTAAGKATSKVTIARFAPAFLLFDARYPAGVIPALNGSNNYDLLGPPGRFTFATKAVHPGAVLLLYGGSFGPTTPTIPAGQLFSGAAATANKVTVTIGGIPADVQFAGLTGAGLYQFNVVVPAVASGDQLLQATVGGVQTPLNIYIPIQ